jgi:hypothetical protein
MEAEDVRLNVIGKSDGGCHSTMLLVELNRCRVGGPTKVHLEGPNLDNACGDYIMAGASWELQHAATKPVLSVDRTPKSPG